MLDTCQYDRSITDLCWNTDYVHTISNDAGRSMMGSRQENWFYQQLINSKTCGATWRVIGSQTVFSRINKSVAYGNVDLLDSDAWDGYQANRNRTYQTLYSNNITNNIMISGDSDLVWLVNHAYDPITGVGSISVEFAGLPYGANISIAKSVRASEWLVGANRELRWQELYYRGYYELHITQQQVNAYYFGMLTIVNRNPNEISLANFMVTNGENSLHRFNGSVVNSPVENGFVKFGHTKRTNITNATDTDLYFLSHAPLEVL